MGVKITELLPMKAISITELKGKVIAVDSSLFLYQFLTTIRQRDGTPLMDSKGNVTSHLTGMFTRTAKLVQNGLKLVYVFDGKAPELKRKERERRAKLKEEAQAKYNIAVKKKDIDDMKKYASRTTRLTPDMVNETKELITAMGLPIVQAPSEGEAQAAHIVKKGEAYALATQDADALMFNSPRVVRNLSIIGKKKMINKLSYETVKPELIELDEVLNKMGIDRDQLIALSMLVGTDYNIGGIKGIGPKNAIKLVKKHGSDMDTLFQEVKWDGSFEIPWTDVFYTIKKMPVSDDYKISWGPVDRDAVMELLVEKHDFSKDRIDSTLDKISKDNESKNQKGLGEWF